MADDRDLFTAAHARADEERERLAKNQRELFRDASIQAKFLAYHAENPHVMDLIVAKVRWLVSRGFRHFGMKAIFENLRWEHAIETRDESGFKLCNTYTSRYSRLVEELHPDLVGFFRLRELRAEREDQ